MNPDQQYQPTPPNSNPNDASGPVPNQNPSGTPAPAQPVTMPWDRVSQPGYQQRPQTVTPVQPRTGPTSAAPYSRPQVQDFAQTQPQASNPTPPVNTTPYQQQPLPVQPAVQPVNPYATMPSPYPSVPLQTEGKATAALVFSVSGMIAWLLPVLGVPVSLIGLVLSIMALRSGKKLAKLALTLAIVGLMASVASAAVGGYMGVAMLQSGEDSIQTDSQNRQSSDSASNQYPDDVRATFMESCVDGGGTNTQCACILNQYQDNVPYEEFFAIDKEIRETGKVPSSFQSIQTQAIQKCS